MRRLALSFVAVVLALFASAAPAAAITYGEPDAGEHPYVGFIIYEPTEPGWFSCSGTLLDADTFLTAGHCTYGIGTDGRGDVATSGGTDVWVTFDDTEVLAGWPARADYPDRGGAVRARRAWLEPPASSRAPRTRPRLRQLLRLPVELRRRRRRARRRGTGAHVRRAGRHSAPSRRWPATAGRNAALVETVGYGIQSVQPHPMDVETRYKSTSRIVEVNGNISDRRQRAHVEQPQRHRRPRWLLLRRLRRPGVRQQHEPGPRRRLVRLQRHLPRRRLLVAGRHPGQLRVHPAVPRPDRPAPPIRRRRPPTVRATLPCVT